MIRRALPLVAATSLLVPLAPTSAAPPAGAISSNVEYVTTLPEVTTAISINFIGDTMFVSTQTGLFSYNVSNPRSPQLLGALPEVIWENEDVDVDAARNLVFISRDPRPVSFSAGGVGSNSFPKGTIEVVNVANPRAMYVESVVLADAWHTTTCIQKCLWLWSGGPFAYDGPVAPQPADWNGRPIFGTDLHDPLNPKPCPAPIDLNRNDGKTDYAHDVQVDERGIAWVSGFGGVRGYWTSGKHYNPTTRKVETADGCHPVPYAGGGTELGRDNSIMHNARRNPAYAVDRRKGDLLIATEEDVTSSCENAGRAATFDLRGSYDGGGWTRVQKQRIKLLDVWTPEDETGSNGCASAHYFADRGDGIVAWAFYEQGTRFLDVSNPRHIRQVGYYRPGDATTWAAYFHKGYVFVADNSRGVDVIKFSGKGGGKSKTLIAPPLLDPPALPLRFRPSPELGWLCPVPR